MKGMGEKLPISFESEGELREQIQIVVNEINLKAADDKQLFPYIRGVNEMHQFFSEVHRKNIKLLEAIQEMNATLVTNATKIQLITKATEGDHDCLSKMKAEYEEASRMVSFAHESETKSKQLLQTLRGTLGKLTDQVQRGEAFSFGQDGSIFEVQQDVTNLTKERDADNIKIREIQMQIAEHKTETGKLEQIVDVLAGEVKRLESGVAEKEKLISSLTAENKETKNILLEMKPKIPEMKAQVEQGQKKKAELQKSTSAKKQQQRDFYASLGQLRDESRSLREKDNRRGKHRNELRKIGDSRVVRIETAKERLAAACSELTRQKAEIVKTEKLLAENTQIYDSLMKESEEVARKKAEVRKVVREMRPKVIKLQFNQLKGDNDILADQRELKNMRLTLAQRKQNVVDAEFARMEIEGHSKTVKNETRHFKPILDDQKDKITVLYQEIDQKRSELHKLAAGIYMCQENKRLICDENARQMAELKELQKKGVKQDSLSEQLRDERNNSKRALEQVEKENAEMTLANNHLELQINELSERWSSMLREIAEDHFQIRCDSEHIDKQTRMIEEVMKNVMTVERMISRLGAERQTLSQIIRDAKHDHLQQEKERQRLANNHLVVQQDLHQKEETVERLRNQIKSEEAFLRRCSELYNDKVKEVSGLMEELKSIEKVTMELEERKEKLVQLQNIQHRTFADLVVEKHKTVNLIHEFSVPRNVHRWEAIEAVDPGYVKNIKFKCGLSAKFDAAHRELIELRKERDKLKKEAEEMERKANETPSKAFVIGAIQAYKEDLVQMDAEIEEIKGLVDQSKKEIGTKREKVSGARSSLTQRRGTALSVKLQNKETRASSQLQKQHDDEPVYYMTESPLFNPTMGGGFSIKQTMHSRKSIPLGDLKVGPSSPMAKTMTRKTSYGPLIQLTGKGMRSPTRFYGKNLVLPSIEATDTE